MVGEGLLSPFHCTQKPRNAGGEAGASPHAAVLEAISAPELTFRGHRDSLACLLTGEHSLHHPGQQQGA